MNTGFQHTGGFTGETLQRRSVEPAISSVGSIGPLLQCRNLVRKMKAQGAGSIINISTMDAIVAPNPALFMKGHRVAESARLLPPQRQRCLASRATCGVILGESMVSAPTPFYRARFPMSRTKGKTAWLKTIHSLTD